MDDKYRVGFGYDIHKIKAGKKGLLIGGVKLSNTLQFEAHSDGDVLIHALIDSLLGAVGERDIGELFPNDSDQYKDIKSSILLSKIVNMLNKRKINIINIDSVIVIEKIKLAPFKEQIRRYLSEMLSINQDRLNIKAKTKEGIGEVGLGSAIECYCTALLYLNN